MKKVITDEMQPKNIVTKNRTIIKTTFNVVTDAINNKLRSNVNV